jgi:hypothetical protein
MAEGVIASGAASGLADGTAEGFLGIGLSLGTEITLVVTTLFASYLAIGLLRYYLPELQLLQMVATTLGFDDE